MKNDKIYKLTWQDVIFGLIGSTICVVLLQLFTIL